MRGISSGKYNFHLQFAFYSHFLSGFHYLEENKVWAKYGPSTVFTVKVMSIHSQKKQCKFFFLLEISLSDYFKR
jgi:hypothetical protein